MGNKSLNVHEEKKENNKIEENEIDIKTILINITPNRKQQLIDFLLSNIATVEELQKREESIIKNEKKFFPFVSRLNYYKDIVNSHFILISNDIIIVPTNHIYQDNKEAYNLSFTKVENSIHFDIFHIIVENDNYNNNFSIIKILNKEFNFKNYFEIPNKTIDIESNEKFYINEKDEEESLGININRDKINEKNNISRYSPIYIKKNDKLFLVGITNENNEFYIFEKDEILNIKKKIENIEFKYKLYHIKKLDFNNINFNDDEMYFIFQYDLINLEYLDLQNKNITNKGIKALQNKSLINLKYLNLSNNHITDD